MLRSLKDLEHYTVGATDGDVGTVVNFFVDDLRWVVRYLIVESHGFADGRRALISPISFVRADWSTHHFYVALTKEKVRNSPSVDDDKPVSRQLEREVSRYYDHPCYWKLSSQDSDDKSLQEVHLRSTQELCGYHVHGIDAAVGHVHDFIVDDETWEVPYLVVDTSNWWFGKKVLIAPTWARRIHWKERKIFVDLSRQQIKDSPEWHPDAVINRTYESRLHDHYGYGRLAYWIHEDRAESPDQRKDQL